MKRKLYYRFGAKFSPLTVSLRKQSTLHGVCPLANVLAMASLGFRPPQFSEDAAWLPAWLQHPQAKPFDALLKESQTPSEQAFKDLALLQENINDREDAKLISGEDGRFVNCHLFLSGDDNSPVSFSLSSGNVSS
ncbi:hypothetical protein L1049_012040 [Liquidambar formosana]|uniref:Uncharacterized protein n=1 Tax=Liquidambar formosana TaxID=63359 RepID=A0AAP0RS86_LIQFO